MSIDALNWAWEQDCPNPTSKLVLMALADHANADGECWPSMKKIAQRSGITPRQVSTHITRLAELGLVEKASRRRYGGQFRGWDYRVNVHRKQDTSGSTLPVTSGSPASSPAEADFRSEPSGNHQVEPLAAAPRETVKPKAPRPTDLMFDTMVRVCGINPATLTGSERGRINKALKELREVGATPHDIEARATAYRKKYPDAAITPTALTGNWSALQTARHTAPVCDLCRQRLDNHDAEICVIVQNGGI